VATFTITHIKKLVNVREQTHVLNGGELAQLPCMDNAYLTIENDTIAAYGRMDEIKNARQIAPSQISAEGQFILPCWCDSHTHLVFAASREQEFVDKIKGISYAQINQKGGGILNSAHALQAASEDDLFRQAWARLEELSKLGTGSLEIKSGYGLTVDAELKMLRVIKKLREKSAVSIKATFLGAHSFPLQYRDNHQGYIDSIITEMLPVIAAEKLADYIDVFCEQGFFNAQETETICAAGKRYGLRPKLHVNQLHSIGGIEAGIRVAAVSMDHLEILSDSDLALLSGQNGASPLAGGASTFKGLCTLLPTAAFFLGVPFPAARKLIDSGACVALASDFNPGTSPSGNMNLVVAMSCIQMKMLPEEAINAATLNGAYAMDMGNEVGSIAVGKKANLILTKPMPSLAYLPYAFGTNLVDRVMLRGSFIS
jgi:imidazolonepropionase